MSEHPRTQSARDHDDTDVIEGMIPGGTAQTGSSSNAEGRDLGSRDDLKQVDDPDGHTRATKQADIDAGQARPSSKRGDI